MGAVADEEQIRIPITISLASYELLLATATVLDWEKNSVVEALIDLHARQMTREMLEVG